MVVWLIPDFGGLMVGAHQVCVDHYNISKLFHIFPHYFATYQMSLKIPLLQMFPMSSRNILQYSKLPKLIFPNY